MENTILRSPRASEGAAVWSFIRRVGSLDLNSAYCYIMLCDRFKETCVIAEAEGEIIGFASAYQSPSKDDTLFVWQVAVAKSVRGRGLSKAMLAELMSRRSTGGVTYLEATVSPSNVASHALFNSIARSYHAELRISDGYRAQWFPDEQAHEDELLYRVGPIINEGVINE